MLYNLTSSDVDLLERSHRYCIKYMQGLPNRTRTIIALGLLGLYPIEAEIDLKKLVLFGQMCNLESGSSVKDVFLMRMSSYITNNEVGQSGYFKDILTILMKYNLDSYLYNFESNGTFPSKFQWKCILKSAVKRHVESDWYSEVSTAQFSFFQKIHPHFTESIIWSVSKFDPTMNIHCRNVIDLVSRLSSFDYMRLCSKCGIEYPKEAEHCLFTCDCLEDYRNDFTSLIPAKFGVNINTALGELDRESFIGSLLGNQINEIYSLLGDNVTYFIVTGIVYLSNLWTCFKR